MSFLATTAKHSLIKSVLVHRSVQATSERSFLWFGKEKVRFPKDLDHATGEERLVRLAIAKGIKDPFDMQEQVRGPGTKGKLLLFVTFTKMFCISQRTPISSKLLRKAE